MVGIRTFLGGGWVGGSSAWGHTLFGLGSRAWVIEFISDVETQDYFCINNRFSVLFFASSMYLMYFE